MSNRTRHAVYQINYHFVWCPKYRRPVLAGDVGRRLTELLHELVGKLDGSITAVEVQADHVHLLIDHSYMLSASTVMKNLKGISSRRLFQKYKANRYEIRKLWGRSFDARKIVSDQKETIINYIKGQRSPAGIDKR